MNLTSREAKLLTELLTDLAADFTITDLRERVGQKVIDLLGAQYFASYIWNSDKSEYGHRVAVNMSDANLANYEHHFQFRDPITPILQKRRDTTRVVRRRMI